MGIIINVMKKLFLPVLASLLLAACGSGETDLNTIVSGNLANGGQSGIRLYEMEPGNIRPVDSVVLPADGSFRFAFSSEEPGFYLLVADDGRRCLLLAGPGDRVTVDGDYRRLPEGLAFGGPANTVSLGEFYSRSYANKAKADSLQEILAEHAGDTLFTELTIALDSAFRNIWENQRNLETAYIVEHPASIGSLAAIDYSFGTRPVLSMNEDFSYYLSLYKSLSEAYPHNRHVLFYCRKVDEYRRQKELKQGDDR